MNPAIKCHLCGRSSHKKSYGSLPELWQTYEAHTDSSKFVLAYCPSHSDEKIREHFKNFKQFVEAREETE